MNRCTAAARAPGVSVVGMMCSAIVATNSRSAPVSARGTAPAAHAAVRSRPGRAARAIPGVEIVACYGRDASKTADLSRELGATPYASLADFVEHPGLDIALVGSPSGLHAEHALAAVRRGVHVLVEKPLDIT